MTPILGFLSLNPTEILIILALGLLLFGRKLPEVGRYLGKGIVEFKKGMKGLEDEIDTGSAPPHSEALTLQTPPPPPQRVAPSVPKFEDKPSYFPPPKT